VLSRANQPIIFNTHVGFEYLYIMKADT